jgi:hypothetical protein
MITILLASVLVQGDEAAKVARLREALVGRFEKLDALDGKDLAALRRAYTEFAAACEDFLWDFEQYVAAYEIFALMGKAAEKVAVASDAAGEDGSAAWKQCFSYLGKPRMLLKEPAVAGDAEVRRVVLLAAAAEGKARLEYAKKNPKALGTVVAIAKEVAPTDAELRGSEDAARVRLNAVRALARSGDSKAAAESLSDFLALRPLKATAAEPPKPEAVKALIEKLGAESIDERDAAARSLLLLGRHAVKALEEAARSQETEVASRAKAVLAAIRQLTDSTTVAGHALAALDEVFAAEKADRAALLALAAAVARQDPGALKRPAVKALLLKELRAGTAAAVEAVSAAAGKTLTAEEAAAWLER